jgi:hypothetical protein
LRLISLYDSSPFSRRSAKCRGLVKRPMQMGISAKIPSNDSLMLSL